MSALLACKGLPVPTLISRAIFPYRAFQQPRRAQRTFPARGHRSMGAVFSASASSDLSSMIRQKNAENPVMVYSKTYCPYCAQVKGLFTKLNVPFKLVELDELADGDQVQLALKEVTGRSTVPQVFVGGKHVGGCDDTMAALDSGKLKDLMQAAGIRI